MKVFPVWQMQSIITNKLLKFLTKNAFFVVSVGIMFQIISPKLLLINLSRLMIAEEINLLTLLNCLYMFIEIRL